MCFGPDIRPYGINQRPTSYFRRSSNENLRNVHNNLENPTRRVSCDITPTGTWCQVIDNNIGGWSDRTLRCNAPYRI